MNIRDFASQFTIYIFANDLDQGAGIKVALSQAGYDAFFFESRDVLLSRVKERPPHLVIFSVADVGEHLSDFVQSMLEAAPEIRFIVLAQPDQYETLAAYNPYGLVDILEDRALGLTARALFSTDRACEGLYRIFQNEMLLQQAEELESKLSNSQRMLEALKKGGDLAGSGSSAPGFAVSERIRDYLSAESKEALVSAWIQGLGGVSCVYLQYLPTVRSLLAVQATSSEGKGMGCHLTAAEAQDFSKQVTLGVIPPSLEELLTQAFHFKKPRLHPVFVQGQLEGLVGYSADLTPAQKTTFEDEVALFALAYAHFAMEKRLDAIEVLDPVTEVYNRKFGEKRIQDEWSRAKRIQQPLCLVKMALDDFLELEQALGDTTRDHLLKNLAQLVQKSSRGHDVVYRSGRNELTMILPHCTRQGAMIRGERLRRVVESSQMLENGLKVSLSLGISEYPTLAADPASLESSASKALSHIMEKGGNKLCLSKAPPRHKPDFEVILDPATDSKGP